MFLLKFKLIILWFYLILNKIYEFNIKKRVLDNEKSIILLNNFQDTFGFYKLIQYDIDLNKHESKFNKSILNFRNIQYIVEMGIGEPNNKYKFIIDTGSSITLVDENKYKKTTKNNKNNESSTYIKQNKKIQIKYAKGVVDLQIGKDNFYFGDIQIKNMNFGSIIDEKNVFQKSNFDGIWGLSYSSMGYKNYIPFFDNIINQKLLNKNIFSLFLSRNTNKPSKLQLGGYNNKYYEGNINWHNLIEKTWWTLKLTGIKINGELTDLCNEKLNCKIIMDSGSSLMATPPYAYQKVINLLSKNKNCKNLKIYPDITFIIDNKEYTLKGFEYIITKNNELNYKKKVKNPELCTIGFSVFDVGKENVWIAGDIFLSKFFTIYDKEKNRVGLALAKKFN